MSGLPCVLVLGGLGFIGRNFVKYLVEAGGSELVSHIRVVDKAIPAMAHLTKQFQQIFDDPLVELIQGDVNNDVVLNKCMVPPPSSGCQTYALVVNLASTNNYNLPEEMYEAMITGMRVKCAVKARDYRCDKYIEVSTGQVYKGDGSNAAKEASTALKPWTVLAQYHLAAEQHISRIQGLNWMVLRLPNVYGPGDLNGLMPRIACAAAYEYVGNTMNFLWGADLRMHTVHVQDVAAALWFLLVAGEVGETYNLSDDNDTSQGKFNKVLEQTFSGLKTNFLSRLESGAANLVKGVDSIAEEANQEHLETWLEMTKETNTGYTPVSVEVHKSLLDKNPLALDSSKIKMLGFQCSCPAPNVELIKDSIDYWLQQNKWPKIS